MCPKYGPPSAVPGSAFAPGAYGKARHRATALSPGTPDGLSAGRRVAQARVSGNSESQLHACDEVRIPRMRTCHLTAGYRRRCSVL